ncbi:MAG: 3-phosphoshikimate 1-carboxyvinyltransferase [Actinomycetota bacterium]
MTGPVLRRAAGPIDASVQVPGSKSVANRALVCGALANGQSEIAGLPGGDDTVAMIEGLGRLGVDIEIRGSVASVRGRGADLAGGTSIDARLAGTTSRFLTAVAALGPATTRIDGESALRRRPMGVLHDALARLGAFVEAENAAGHLPVRVARGTMNGGTIALAGDTSSQFVTALMLIAPLLENGLTIEITSTLVSRPYVEMTAAVMSSFGAGGIAISDGMIRIESGGYVPTEYHVEADASSASYPLAAAAITGGRVTVNGLGKDSLQGDAVFADILARMGCEIEVRDRHTTVTGRMPLSGVQIDMADFSDLVPTVAVVAAFADSPTTIDGVGFIRHKESDRLADLAEGLRRIGCGAEVLDDGLRVVPQPLGTYHGAELSVHHDHRLAMAWSLLALRVEGITVDDPGVVTKSWPDWWTVRDRLIGSRS